MATRKLRRGLPRVHGGEPWPPGVAIDGAESGASPSPDAPAGADPVVGHASIESPAAQSPVAQSPVAQSPVAQSPAAQSPVFESPDITSPAIESSAVESTVQREDDTAPAATGASLRRGLPRVRGGEAWPPAGTATGAAAVAAMTHSMAPPSSKALADSGPVVEHESSPSASASSIGEAAAATSVAAATEVAAVAQAASPALGSTGSVRRGLPRVAGGDPWPPAGTVPVIAVATDASESAAADALATGPAAPAPSADVTRAPAASTAVAPASASFALGDPSIPLPAPRTVWNGSAPRRITAAAPASARPRPPWTQAIAGLLGAAALGVLAAAAVAFVRALLSFPFMQDFLAAFPGEYTPAIAVEPGFAPWVNWAHFFNVFLMVLIIRSGLRIRNEKRPTAFWTPRGDPKGKVSLTIWFHQALDILWLVNGVIFVVLLFVTGHWVRIVPTSWEVIPNALSAALQYVSFDWPTEHGWVNYNSLQQLAYFVTVFIAAPLAAATGFRMSGMWPKKAERLSRAYPIEWARALHFPVMIYFVVFIIGHVALVFLTGFLRNLNHMYASSDAVGWTGFWVFVASVVVIALGWVAARPLVIAPIAKLFGTVSGR
ncbi:cytochrome b/b6 domain-containing protein [Microbacterium sp. LWH13-1.2]|uniref:cytochrome b/b6 domain-containing protein n=1 Tax=Microbacterium sp. LWH13-1.2 TaxID=3135260 RepID=UPI0031389460